MAGVWVGNSDGSPMQDVLSARGAGLVWHQFMEAALQGAPPTPFTRPPDVVEKEVCQLSGLLPTPDCPQTVSDLFAQADLPNKPDDLHRRVEVCKANGKLAFDRVPANARESKVFVVFPEPYTDWGQRNGYPAPPSQRCDDVYRGVRVAEIDGPPPETPLSGTVQVVGSAMLDDFNHLDLEVGAGANPTVWSKITEARTEGVDRALLGVWNTAGFPAGRYTLRLTVYDSFGNAIQRTSPVVVGTVATPTPVPSPAPFVPPQQAPLFGAPPTPTVPGPERPTPLPSPAIAPRFAPEATATPRRR